MDTRYQVFVSSTYADLRDERRAVLQALMEMDCIPAGMELFPAGDDEQFQFIKSVIDDCDYYLLIIGGRCALRNSTTTGQYCCKAAPRIALPRFQISCETQMAPIHFVPPN